MIVDPVVAWGRVKMSSDQIRQVIADQLHVDLAKVVDKARLCEDLGADSLDVIELAIDIEERCGVDIDSLAARPKTVGDLIQAVERAKQ